MNTSLRSLAARFRDGDAEAAEELVREYGPLIRCEVRVWLSVRGVRPHFETEDLCQSVFLRLLGELQTKPESLEGVDCSSAFVKQVVRHLCDDRLRHATAACRTYQRAVGGVAFQDLPARDEEPWEALIEREEIDGVRRRLSDSVRLMLDRRLDGQRWAQIASELGGSTDALRRRLERALRDLSDREG